MRSDSSVTLATRQPGHEAARLLLAVCLVGAAWICAQAEPASPPDAVIELWEQHWTLGADGSTVYYNKQFVRLNNDRSFGEFADPRLTYDVATDKLEIMHARVKLADGSYRELPDYSHVLVTPDATSGWPSFANIRQHLLVMSGIEPGCVVELEYQITSAPGARSGWAADVRLTRPLRRRAAGPCITCPPGRTSRRLRPGRPAAPASFSAPPERPSNG
jgi:hypothetical protein